MGENNTAKVSDFGLARDIKGAEEYLRNNQVRLIYSYVLALNLISKLWHR